MNYQIALDLVSSRQSSVDEPLSVLISQNWRWLAHNNSNDDDDDDDGHGGDNDDN